MKFTLIATLCITLLASCQKEVSFECIDGKCTLDTSIKTPIDTTITDSLSQFPKQIPLNNAGFENDLDWWQVEYPGEGSANNFFVNVDRVTKDHYLNFYATQPSHYNGAPEETPFWGDVMQTVNDLPAGHYVFKAIGGATGEEMYIYVLALSETGEWKEPLKYGDTSQNEVEFDLTAPGSVNVGFNCLGAKGDQPLAPYFHIFSTELWQTK